MLDYKRIKEISAIKGVIDIVVEKDYILDWILWGISQNLYLRNRIVFKGGTALHKMYFPDWRFSEDLDFTTIKEIRKDKLNDAINVLCDVIRKKVGIELQTKEITLSGKELSEWFYEIKIEYRGPRGQITPPLPTILIHITVDELLIDMPIIKRIIAPYEDVPLDFFILTYSLEEIFAEKVRTILHQRCFPKDIYDTWRILGEVKNLININKFFDIYFCKTRYRDKIPGIPNDIDNTIQRLRNNWTSGIQRQIGQPPNFEIVYPDIVISIKNLFKDYDLIKIGGIDMLESNYLIRYKKGDLEIEVQGDKTFVEEKFKELSEFKYIPVKKDTNIPQMIPAQEELDKKLSLVEFLKSKNLKSHGDKILVFSYYLEKNMNESSFNINDIEKCYLQTRTPKTKNFRPYITQLIRDGYIMDADEKKNNKKAWILTDAGLKYVEELGKDMIES